MLLAFIFATAMGSLLVSFLILLLIVCVIAALVIWILSNIPGVPPWSRNVVLAIAGLVILIWVIQHFGGMVGL
jgi:hypothetical protein